MDIQQLLESVEKIKVSIVMQVNLMNYAGSRENASDKLIRAIDSFQNQIYKNTELIIVSDGCARTHQIYNKHFKNNPLIKFVFLDRANTPLGMYETKEGDPEQYKYYRGFARKLGVAAATGSVITYMDSDDILAPEFSMTLMLIYNQDPDRDWWINTTWYDNHVADFPENEMMYATQESEAVELPYIHDLWRQTKMKPGMFVMTPWLLMHKPSIKTQWRDVYGVISEDVDFNKRMREETSNGVLFNKPIYTRCHYAGKWDV
jgi:glycosyltransferase involved in cell wall biosynthesis